MSLKDKCAIVGVGYTPQGKLPDWTVRGLFHEAIKNAMDDAGISGKDIDGIIMQPVSAEYNNSRADGSKVLFVQLQEDLGIECTGLALNYDTMGATAGGALQYAIMAIEAGLCHTVLLAFVEKSATAPTVYYRGGETSSNAGPYGLISYGLFGAMPGIAMLARTHMNLYGTTSKQYGEVAVTFRKHASLNPLAAMQTPITIEDHQNSRYIAEPLHLLDCCQVSDGGRAIIVTSAERAKAMKKAPIYVSGFGQGHVISDPRGRMDLTTTGGILAGKQAFKMAGMKPQDMDVLWLYDATTYNVVTQLEELGFCSRGEGGAFVENGRLSIWGGEYPTNTSGGQLSEVYIQGFTGIPEIVRQLRGECGERQVKDAEVGLATCNGGYISSNSVVILRR